MAQLTDDDRRMLLEEMSNTLETLLGYFVRDHLNKALQSTPASGKQDA